MNPPTAQPHPLASPDARIDQILTALRATEPPTGLELRIAQRIAARLAQAAEARTVSTSPSAAAPSFFAVILNAVKDPCILLAAARRHSAATAAALTVILALTTFTLAHHHRAPATTAPGPQSRVPHLRDGSIVAKVGITPSPTAQDHTILPGLEGAGLESRHNPPAATSASAAAEIPPIAAGTPPLSATTQVPRGFSLASHSSSNTAGVLAPASAPDLDQIALAETLAPSHPAPPMPLTAQEKLIQAATRPGQPLQLAELDLARAPLLRAAAQARQHANLETYVKTLLAPFALADALQPNTPSQPQEPPAPPTSNSSN